MYIDIHCHAAHIKRFWRLDGTNNISPEELLQTFDEFNIEKGVLLPMVSPECSRGVQRVEDAVALSKETGGRLIPFCNVDPRSLTNSPDAPLEDLLNYYKEMGCRGAGELTANLPFEDPLCQNLFRALEKTGMPAVIHFAHRIGGLYGMYDDIGLPQLEKTLQRFPELNILGHSQTFWAEMGPVTEGERGGYPEGPITKPGRVTELMRKYPNLHGDLSAGSGFNALNRDHHFAAEFLDEFQDRLYYGNDLTGEGQKPKLNPLLEKFRNDGKLSQEAFAKISKENAIKLLNI